MNTFNIADLNPASAYVNAMDAALKSDMRSTRHETAGPAVEDATTTRTSMLSKALTSLHHILAHVFSFSRSQIG